MKVLYICPNGYLGGAERVVLNLCNGHERSKQIQYHLLFLREGDALSLAKNNHLTYSLCPYFFKLSNPFKFINALFWLRHFIQKEQFDVIHGTMAYGHIVSVFATFLLKCKRVWFQHGPVDSILDMIANHFPSDLILFNSNYLKNEHLKLPNLFGRKHSLQVINLGVDSPLADEMLVQSLRSKFLINDEKFLLLHVGRVSPIKGQLEFLQALLKLKENHQDFYRQIHVLFIGDMGGQLYLDYKKQIKDFMVSSDLQDKVEFLGAIEDLHNYYQAADLTIHTTTIPEAFGLVVAEAMLHHSLVIGSQAGGIQDILIERKTGFAYNGLSPQMNSLLADKIQQVLYLLNTQPDLIMEIKQRAHQKISKEYSNLNFTQNIETYYLNLFKTAANN